METIYVLDQISAGMNSAFSYSWITFVIFIVVLFIILLKMVRMQIEDAALIIGFVLLLINYYADFYMASWSLGVIVIVMALILFRVIVEVMGRN